MSKLKKHYPSAHLFYVNIDKDRAMMKKLRIVAIPTQIIYDKNGFEVYRHLGSMTYEEVVQMLDNYNF
ncbi:MAG: thioredoxin family protein [Epsilonproteobacteria bacterium]|nr:thioredoxin family protein [Campylobacterota bacterium]